MECYGGRVCGFSLSEVVYDVALLFCFAVGDRPRDGDER